MVSTGLFGANSFSFPLTFKRNFLLKKSPVFPVPFALVTNNKRPITSSMISLLVAGIKASLPPFHFGPPIIVRIALAK